MSTENTPDLVVQVDQGIMTITLNRPHVRNALSPPVTDGLRSAFVEMDERDDVRVGVLTGAGGYFSAGMDLAAFADGSGFSTDLLRDGRPIKPLIAAIEGFAFAGGLELALACDLIVCSSAAIMGIPEVKRGLFAPAGALLRLPKRIPFHVAMQMALTGDPITASRAYELGLVNVISEPGAALDEAIALAARILVNAPLGVQVSKELIGLAVDHPEETGWRRTEERLSYVFDSADAIEGPRAFLEKRAAKWIGA